MIYMGSKSRYAKYLLPIILKDRKKSQCYVEPFCGGCNLIDKVSGPRIASDNHYYLIKMWKALQRGWIPPKNVSEDEYEYIRYHKSLHDPALVGYVGFNASYAYKWFNGYCRHREGKRDYPRESYNNIIKQIPSIMGIEFSWASYTQLKVPENSIIYCDIPYYGTTGYTSKFDHKRFWEWANHQAARGHSLYVSEYTAPKGWSVLWSKTVKNTIAQTPGSKQGTEKLFTRITT